MPNALRVASRRRLAILITVVISCVLSAAFIFGPSLRSASAASVVMAAWGFDGVTTTNTGQTPTVSVGSPAADSGALTAGSSFTAFHTSTATTWSNPAGNGSAKSVSSNNWGIGDYYQFSFSTSGYSALSVTWDQTGSSTGPRDFKVQYSTNGTSFTDASGTNSTYVVTAQTWSTSGIPQAASRRTLDLSGVPALENQSTVYIRLVDVSTTSVGGASVGTGGTGRVDNFTVNGTAIVGTPTPTPTPSPSPTNPSGTGTASPNSVFPGNTTLLTVNVTPGTNPTSSGLSVVADLTTIGGSANQSFSGSGNTFTYTATVANGTTPGVKSLPFTISDAELRSGGGSISLTVQAAAPSNNVVISQVYGGGGNTGSTLKNDYIELINHSGSPVNLSGWSVQAYVVPQSGTPSWQMTPLTNFTLQPGQYYLVQESQGAGGTDNLPTPDAIGTIPVSSTSTKVALVNNTTLITAACPDAGAAGIVDLVGYGGTDCFEGSGAAPVLTNTTAALRLNEGCFDTNDNSVDFVSGSPNPRNSSTPIHLCTGLSATGSANPNSVLQGSSTTLTVHVAPAQDPTSSGLNVTADLTSIGGSASQTFSGSGTTFTYFATVSASTPSGAKSLPVTVTDGQGRTANTTIVLSVLSTTPEHVTISQVYGGGGNTGATYQNDYVELYNPTASPISMTGWSLQYGPATGTTFTGKTVLGGTIEPGHYYLISLASGGAVGSPLPPAAVTGDINMAAGAGKIVLVSNADTLIGACPVGTDPDIVDFVGYGTTANCHEGSANAPAPSNSTADFRKADGSTDTDQNGNDFVTGTPNPRSTTPPVEFGPSVAGTDPANNATIAPYDSSISVDFSEPVDAVGTWYNVSCVSTGLHNSGTVAHSDNFKTWAFTPNVTFQFGEQCTATIYKDQIHDQDTDDSTPGTDTLAADYVLNFTVVGAGQPAPYPPSVHLTMGNPSNAVADPGQPLNYLMMKPTYATSYNRDKGTPNWVSWHLDSSWYGTLARVDTFRPDPAVDPTWYRVQAFDYSGSGFDRGHMTPNADRDNQFRIPINQETYLMSNMVPQSPDNNQGPWANLEAELRTQADAGNEIYIVSGPAGVGGVGSASGNTINTIANGHVTVPSSTWKVALVLPKADGDDISRVTCSTKTIAVLMPNIQGIRTTPWQNFLTTVDAIEQLTGYDLYSNLPPAVQACVEAGTNGTNPPGTADESANTSEDNAVTVTLQALQANNNTLTFSIVNGPTSGSLGSVSAATCNSGTCTATVTYTPAGDFNGSDSFTFRASDGTLNSNTSTVNVGVSEVNDSPTAVDDNKSTNEDTQLNFAASDLTGNDSAGPANESGQTLTVSSVTATANTHGTVSLNSGQVTYTPDGNYNGPASFSYQMCDNGTTNSAPDAKCASGTVNVTVNSINDDPDAVDDATTISEDSGANTISVLGNDTDTDADTLSVSAVTQGTHGSVTNNVTSVSYTPNADYFGTDTFTYTVSDGNGGTDTATVTVTVTNVEDAPDAVNDSSTINEDSGANTINVRSNDVDVDGDTLTVTAVTQGAHGAVAITNSGADVSYTPAANFYGSDSFTYTVNDGHGGTDTATVNVTVNNVNDAPVATGDSYVTDSNTTLNVPAPGVLGNDSDIDGPSLSAQLVTGVSHGTLTLNADGSFSYSPSHDFEGSDSFTYQAYDGSLASNVVTVNITVNDKVPPALTTSVAINLITSTNSNLFNVGLAASATDNSGDPVTITVAVFGDEDDQTATIPGVVHSPDAKDIAVGTLRLRGERVEANDGRVYLIIVTATDSSGNVSRGYQTVVVPKNNKQANIDLVNAQAANAVQYAQANNGAPPPTYFVIGDGPIIGPKQ